MKIPEQLNRLGIVVAVVVVIVLSLRFLILPPSLFSAAPHQAATVVREMDKPLHHAGATSCRECHAEQFDAKYAGHHRDVGCENCHGPSARHVADENAPSAMPPKPRDREFCLDCHGYDASRPNGFPQVDPQQHNARKRCVSCHDPHDPVPPETPQECGGCHGRIEHTKALSAHALLSCTRCHTVDARHMVDPRAALPSKPADREFCGHCHTAGSTDPGAARTMVDLDMHGKSYVCWECHYAHLPEGPK